MCNVVQALKGQDVKSDLLELLQAYLLRSITHPSNLTLAAQSCFIHKM